MALKVANWPRLLWLCLALTLCSAFHTAAQEENPQPAVSNPQSEKSPLFWADGITRAGELDAYKAQGFNVVVVRLFWRASPNGEISAFDLAPQRAFAEEAARRGLKIIYALPAAPSGLETPFRLSASSGAYVSLWTAWLQGAVASLRDTPNLIGWMLPDDPRALPFFDDAGFQNWINQNYAGVGVVNRQWKARFESLDDISITDVNQLISNWSGEAPLTEKEQQNSVVVRREREEGWAFHPAALALAHYKWDAYRALVTTWVGALRGEDKTRLVFSGRTPDYAQLLSLPAGIDVAVPDLAPDVGENDIVTHNPQAIDIARRGGKFGVLPVLSPRVSADLPASALPDLTRRWIAQACARGARGVGFDSWSDLRAVPGLSAAISEEISKFSKPAYAQIWGEAPINTSAILLTPLADGATRLFGTPPQRFPRGLYGFGENLVSGEPSTLVQTLRWGTAFGGIDYISPDDLNDAPLERYRTLVAPQLLSAGMETTAQLTGYVSTGGVLIADLGVGAMQNGGEVNALPPPLAELFGISGALTMHSISFNLAGVAPHPLFPAWSNLIGVRPGAALTAGDGPDGSAFAGPVGLSPAPPQATILATGPRIGQKFGAASRILSAPLTINSVGRGYAIFAPFHLWTHWRPGQAGFDTFLGDAMRRDAAVMLPTATSLVPLPATAALGQTLFPEIVNRSASVTMFNHNAPGDTTQMSVLQTAGAGDWLWSGGLVHFTPRINSALVGGRSAPIEGASEAQTRPRPVLLYAVLRPGEMRALSMRPIALQNVDGGPLAAQINEESAQRLKISVWPNAETVLPHEGEWNAAIAGPASVRLTLFSSPSGYLAAPGTRHRARIVNYGKAMGKNRYLTTEKIAAADARGQLVFEFSGAHCAVEITPVVQPASGSNRR